MFEIIQTQQIFNLTCYKVRTSHSIEWYYFKGKETKDIRYVKGLKYFKEYKRRSLPIIVALNNDDWADAKKFLNSLN